MNLFKRTPPQDNTELSAVPIKDLAVCLYEEYQKVEKLKADNEALQAIVTDYKHKETERQTQLVVINELKRESEQKSRKIDQMEQKQKQWLEQERVYKARIATNELNARKLETHIENLEQGMSVRSYNEALRAAISEFEDCKNLGKNQAVCLLDGMLRQESEDIEP